MQQSISGTTRPSRATSTETPNPPSSGGKKVRYTSPTPQHEPASSKCPTPAIRRQEGKGEMPPPPHAHPQSAIIWRGKGDNLPKYTGVVHFIPSLPQSFIPLTIHSSFHSLFLYSFPPPFSRFISPSILHSSTHPSFFHSLQVQIRS